ncbi:MAG: hypothetical protein CEE43_12355 [Promethearchaeota archaeon Loki_b32]|nr:MAG: hypothetical protein CEE43_12355 [Candidatus Lokiarchaeota archaeon Loki_b32]
MIHTFTTNLDGIEKKTVKNMVNDFASSQFSTLMFEISEGLASGNLRLNDIGKFIGTLASFSSDPEWVIKIFLKEIFSKRDRLNQFRDGASGEYLKMPSKYTFLFSVSDWVTQNAKLQNYNYKGTAIDSVVNYLNSLTDAEFSSEIKSLANRYYRSKYLLNPNFFKSLKALFTDRDFLRYIVRESEVGTGYQLLWRDSVGAMIEAMNNGESIKLSRSMIPTTVRGNPVYIIEGGIWKRLSDLSNSYDFGAAHLYVYRKLSDGSRQIGIARIDNIENDLSNIVDTNGEIVELYEGFPVSDSRVIKGVWLSNSMGNLLISEVALDDFSIRSDQNSNWFEEFIEIENGELKSKLFMSYIIASGSKLTCFLQDTSLKFEDYEPYKKIFPDLPFSQERGVKFIREGRIVVDLSRNTEITEPKVNALYNIFFQITETSVGRTHVGVPRIIFSESALNLHSSDKRYTFKLYENILKNIRLKASGALFDSSSPIYNSQNKPHYDSADSNYWLNMITRFSISGDSISLTKVSKKEFFNAWLLLIQNELLVKNGPNWEIDPNSAFYDLKYLVFTNGDPNLPEKFTDNADFQGDETVQGFPNDFEIVEKLEIILHDMFGFTGYASLLFGLMTFSQTEFGGFRSDFVLLSRGDQQKLRRDFNIWTHDTQYLVSKKERGLYYMSIFLNGFEHNLGGTKITSRGPITDVLANLNPEREAFLYEYFEEYHPIDSLDFEDATNFFMEGYQSPSQNKIDSMNLMGRKKLYNYLVEKFEFIVNLIFSPSHLDGGAFTKYIQNPDNPDNWKYRTLKQGRSYIRMSIDNPISENNIVDDLRKILMSGRNGYISLNPPESGTTTAVSSNTLLQHMLVPISYNELVKYLSYDNLGTSANDVIYTLFMTFDTNSHTMPSGYNVNPKVFWQSREGDAIIEHAVDVYNEIISMFSEEVLGSSYYERQFSIKLYSDKGRGIYMDSISDRLKSYGMTDSTIDFHPNDQTELRNAIASMVFYLYFLPDAFAVIKVHNNNFLFADAFSLKTPEYVSDTDYSVPIGGEFIWDSNLGDLTRENYNAHINNFNGFSHQDIRSFFQRRDLESNFEVLLDLFNKLFRTEINRGINIMNFFEF